MFSANSGKKDVHISNISKNPTLCMPTLNGKHGKVCHTLVRGETNVVVVVFLLLNG